jgi:hypothetical protein
MDGYNLAQEITWSGFIRKLARGREAEFNHIGILSQGVSDALSNGVENFNQQLILEDM